MKNHEKSSTRFAVGPLPKAGQNEAKLTRANLTQFGLI
jgi:hypothetical protein